MAQQKTPSIYRIYIVDLQTENQYLGTDIEKSFGTKEVKLEGVEEPLDFSDISNFDELSVKYSNFKALAYSIGVRIPIQKVYQLAI